MRYIFKLKSNGQYLGFANTLPINKNLFSVCKDCSGCLDNLPCQLSNIFVEEVGSISEARRIAIQKYNSEFVRDFAESKDEIDRILNGLAVEGKIKYSDI